MLNNIPTTWIQKYLSDSSVAQVIMGQSPDSSSYNEERDGLPFYQGKTDFGRISPTPRVWCSKPVKIAEADDILLSVRAPVGAVNMCTEKSCIGRGLCAIRTKEIILPKFLYYFFVFYEPILKTQGSGAVFDAITKAFVDKIKVPIPPTLAEQQEIVQVLDTINDIIRLREECISHAQDLIPALFQEMFDNPQTNKKNWQICCLKDLAKIDRQNISPEELKTKQYTYIGLEHIEKETGRILVDPNSQQDIDLKSNKFFFTNNHVLYGKLRPYLNKVALPDFDGVCSTDIFPLLPLEGISNKYFLKVLMNTSYFVNMANSQSSGANLPRIGTTALENIKVFKPDYTLQEQFAQKVIEIESYIKEQNEELENAKQMFQSLLHHAFTGELTRRAYGKN